MSLQRLSSIDHTLPKTGIVSTTAMS